jgi:serralysin
MGGSGSDTIVGSAGNDHIYGYGPTPGPDLGDSLSGGAGDDYIQGNAGNDTIDGGDGNDRILGGQDNDLITGGAGNDSINGNLGADTIDGGAGNDTVRGGQGDDVLSGGDGNDTIMGDMGADTMTGGAGADTFVFHGSDAAFINLSTLLGGHVDTITDFTVGTDHISLGFVPTAVHDISALSLTDALTDATLALTGHGSDVAEVTVGNDTYLFYSSANGAIADSVIDLQGVHGNLGVDSFV